jgi:chlorite dismutase
VERKETRLSKLPSAPLTLKGSSALHQTFHFDWRAWRRLSTPERERISDEATKLLGLLERGSYDDRSNGSAVYSQIGHKGDLFDDSFSRVNQ